MAKSMRLRDEATPVDARYVKANIPAFLIRSLVATLTEFGCETRRLTAGLGLRLSDLADPACRISFRQGREIVVRALRLAKGRALGLETGIREKITSVGLVGYAMLTAATVGDAVKVGLDLQKDTGSMLEFTMRSVRDAVHVTASSRFHDPDIYAFLVEEAFASFMGIGTGLAGPDFRPLRVDLAFPAPPHASDYARIFNCEIRFGQFENAFVCATSWYGMPLATADPLTHRQLLEFMAFSRQRVDAADDMIESVERVLRRNLAEPQHIASVAQSLGLSERTLRRRLAESGVSFQSLIDGLRKARALELLANRAMPVAEVAYAVGFSDPHNFRRAFKRWTGSTPGLVREEITANWPK